jgi:hypothetical protein
MMGEKCAKASGANDPGAKISASVSILAKDSETREGLAQ